MLCVRVPYPGNNECQEVLIMIKKKCEDIQSISGTGIEMDIPGETIKEFRTR